MAPVENIEKKTVKGTLWLSFASVIKVIFQVITLGILARILEPADFGIISTGMVIITILSIIAQFGMNQSIIQIDNLANTYLTTVQILSLIISIFIFFLVLISAPSIAIFFHEPTLAKILPTLALIIPVQSTYLIPQALLNRNFQFNKLAIVELFSYILGRVVAPVYLAVQGYGIWALATSFVAAEIITALTLFVTNKPSLKVSINASDLKKILFSGGGFTLARMGNIIALQGDYFVISKTLGVVSLGIYEKAYQILTSPVALFGDAMEKVLFSANAQVQNEKQRLVTSFLKTMSVISLITLPISAIVFTMAPEIIYTLLGEKWNGVIMPLQILSISMIFRIESKINNSIANATGKAYFLGYIQWVYAITVILFSFAGSRWGIKGVAWGVMGAIALNFFGGAFLSINILQLSWMDIFRAHLPSIKLATITTALLVAFITIFRNYIYTHWIILALTLVSVILSLIPVILYRPNWILSKENLWIFYFFTTLLPPRVSNIALLSKLLRKIESNYID